MMKLIVAFRSLMNATRRRIIQLRHTLVLLILAVYESFFVFQQIIELFFYFSQKMLNLKIN